MAKTKNSKTKNITHTHVQVGFTYPTRFISSRSGTVSRLAGAYSPEYPLEAAQAYFLTLPSPALEVRVRTKPVLRAIAFGSAEDLPTLLHDKLCLLDIVAEPNVRGQGVTRAALDGVGSVHVSHSALLASRGSRPTRTYHVKLLREELNTMLGELLIGEKQ